ncbi:MAG: tetratricopeptide repeat protein [Bacteroidia bacterium]
MRLILYTAFLIFLCFVSLSLKAQEEKKYVREGNKLYQDGKFKEAGEQYRKATEFNPAHTTGNFNLGDALYKQGKTKEAAAKFEELIRNLPAEDPLKAKAYHNFGNSLLREKKYEESIDAYKKALALNPKDDDTRYNLSYARQMLKQQQNKDKKDDKDKKDKKDDKDKKDNKDKKDDKDKKDNKDKKDQKDNKDKKDDKDKKDKKDDKDKKEEKDKKDKEQAQQNQVEKGAAQKMLHEMNNNERKIQARLKKQKEKEKGQPVIIEKDW